MGKIVNSMKKISILGVILCAACLLFAQDTKATFEPIAKCIREGNATALSGYFAGTVECDLLGEEGMYSKAQATMVVKSFFEKYAPKSFVFKHYSNDKQALKYAIGTMQTKAGDMLRVTVFIKSDGEIVKIQQLRIEKE